MNKDKKIELYLDYLNNFLTVSRFAEHYELEKEKAYTIIKEGRALHLATVNLNAKGVNL